MPRMKSHRSAPVSPIAAHMGNADGTNDHSSVGNDGSGRRSAGTASTTSPRSGTLLRPRSAQDLHSLRSTSSRSTRSASTHAVSVDGTNRRGVVVDTFAMETAKQSKYRPSSAQQKASMSRLCQASSRKKVKKVRTNGIAKSALGWVEYHAKQIPGPGEYDILDAVKKFKHKNRGVAKFTVGNPKSDIEWKIYQGKRTPGPGYYDLQELYERERSKVGAKKFGRRPKSDVEWRCYFAAQMPGPGDYDPEKPRSRQSIAFTKGNPKSAVEWDIYRAKVTPGPGQYYRADKSSSVSEMKGGRFPKSQPKSDVDWKIYEGLRTPGPGDYDLPSFSSNVRGAGKFSTAQAKSDVEWKAYSHGKLPGPGAYDIPSTLSPTGGKFTFSYNPYSLGDEEEEQEEGHEEVAGGR